MSIVEGKQSSMRVGPVNLHEATFLSLTLWETVRQKTVSGWLAAVNQFPTSYHTGAYIWNVRDFRSNRGRKKEGLIVMINIGHIGMENR